MCLFYHICDVSFPNSYLCNLLTLSGGMFGLEGGKQVAVVCRLAAQSIRLADVFWLG